MGPGHRQSRHQGIAVRGSLRAECGALAAHIEMVMAGLVPATPIMWHGRAPYRGAGQPAMTGSDEAAVAPNNAAANCG